MTSSEPVRSTYDVVVMGGSLAGAATATLLCRQNPGIRVLIVEKSAQFTRRVGEATVEISAYFLGRVLGMTQHLNESHLVKQGMRFWFYNDEAKTIADASEIGGRFNVRLPSYQLDRAVFDEEVLRRACAAGAELRRPASVTDIRLEAGGDQTVELKTADRTETVRARWVVDASGVAALLARKEGWWRTNADHPTAAAWSRWTGVKDWDGFELARKYPEWSMVNYGIRGTATNHLIGDGWWSWWIPLKGGDVSIGVVFDQRLVDFPTEGKIGDRVRDFLMRHPVARELLSDAEWTEGDAHWRKNLAYSSTTLAGDGFVLVGDAAAFLDPFYSPGMDWISFTASSAAALITASRNGEPTAPLAAEYNRRFLRSYDRWFQGIYQDKYEYLGEFDLTSLAFGLDLGLYYLGIVSQPFKRGVQALAEPPFSTPPSVPVFYFVRFYNRRFARIARERRKRGALGRSNKARRYLLSGYTFSPGNVWKLAALTAGWVKIELTEGWRSWFRSEFRQTTSMGAKSRPDHPAPAGSVAAEGAGG